MFNNAQDLAAEKNGNAALPAFDIRRLRRWHGEKGMSQHDLARHAGLTPRQLRRYESRGTIPEFLERLIAIARALDTTLDQLIAHHERYERRRDVTKNDRETCSGRDIA